MKSWTFTWLGTALWAWMSSLAKNVSRDQSWVFSLQTLVLVSTSFTISFSGYFWTIVLCYCDNLPPESFWKGSSKPTLLVFLGGGIEDLWISCCASSPGMDHTTKYWKTHLISSSNANFENLSSLFRLACLINSFSFANPEYIWIYYSISDHFLGDIGMDGIIWFTHWELWTYSITFLHITAHF